MNDLITPKRISTPSTSSQKVVGRKYKLRRKLGQGSYGCVYQAKHAESKQKVAIKFVAIRSSHHRESVFRETKVLKHLQPQEEGEFHIPKFYDAFEIQKDESPVPLSDFPVDEDSIRSIMCIVTEYIKGGELIEHIQQKNKLKESEAAKLFRQLLVAVQWCHNNGIVHRDIKLENIMMASKTCLKLIDFGLSQFVDSKTTLNNFVGSVAYSAPEVFQGEEYNGAIADIWSCGVVLYTMVTGEFPWEGRTATEQAKNIIQGHWVIPDVSSDCFDLLRSILTTDPSSRFSISEILNHSWMLKYTSDTTKRLSAERVTATGKQELTPTSSLEARTKRLSVRGSLRKESS